MSTAVQIEQIEDLKKQALETIIAREHNEALNLRYVQKHDDHQVFYLTDNEGKNRGFCYIFPQKAKCRYKIGQEQGKEFELKNPKKQIRKKEIGTGTLDDLAHEDAMMSIQFRPREKSHYEVKENNDGVSVVLGKYKIGQTLFIEEENKEMIVESEDDIQLVLSTEQSGIYTYKILRDVSALKINQWVDISGDGENLICVSSTNFMDLESKVTEKSKVHKYADGLRLSKKLKKGVIVNVSEAPIIRKSVIITKKPVSNKKVKQMEAIPLIDADDMAILKEIRANWPVELVDRAIIVYDRVLKTCKMFKNAKQKAMEPYYKFDKSMVENMNMGTKIMQIQRIKADLSENEVILNFADIYRSKKR